MDTSSPGSLTTHNEGSNKAQCQMHTVASIPQNPSVTKSSCQTNASVYTHAHTFSVVLMYLCGCVCVWTLLPCDISLPSSLTLFLSLWMSFSLCLPSHLHMDCDPQLFVYFWDCLIRGQMCRLCLAATACRVGEQWCDSGDGVLICPPVGCNQALSTYKGGGGGSLF